MKLFGEFLIEKGLINKEQLAEALVEQIRTMPSYVELVWRKKLIEVDNLFRVLKIQSEQGVGFREAMTALGLWNEELDRVLQSEVRAARIPLGQILVQQQQLDLGAVTKALDDFLGKVETAPVAAPAPAPMPALAPALASREAPAAVKSPSAIPEASGSLGDSLSPELCVRLTALAEVFSSDQEVSQKEFKEFFDGVHLARGTLRLKGDVSGEAFCAEMEPSCMMLLELSPCPADLRKSLGRTAKAWCGLFSEFVAALNAGKSGEIYFGQPEVREKREKFDSLSVVLKFDLEMAGFGKGA